MSFIATADVLAKNMAYGNYGYRVINDQYEPGHTLEFYSDMVSASSGVMSLATEHVSIKLGAFGSGAIGVYNQARYLFSGESLSDPQLPAQRTKLVADLASWAISGYELLSKVPAPQARAIGVLLGAVGTALDWYISTGEVATANEQELAELKALQEKHNENIERLKELESGAREELAIGSSSIITEWESAFDPAAKKLSVLQDYDISAGQGYDLMRSILNDLSNELAEHKISTNGMTSELSLSFDSDKAFAELLMGHDIDFDAVEAWYGIVASDTLDQMQEIFEKHRLKLDVVLENDAFRTKNFSSDGDDVLLATVQQKFLDGGEGNDTFVLDGLEGHKYIYDKSGNNRIQVNGIILGTANLVIDNGSSDLTFKDEDGNSYSKVVSANGINYDLIINLKGGGSVTIIHWDQSPGLYGISLNGTDSGDEPQVPEQSNDRFIVGDGEVDTGKFENSNGDLVTETVYLKNSFDAREATKEWKDDVGKSLDQSSYNDRELSVDAQELTGSNTSNAVFEGGNLNDSFIGNNGSNSFYGLDGDDYFEGNGGQNKLVGGEGDDHFIASDDGDHIFMDSEDDLDAGGSGDDYALGGAGNDFITGGGGDDVIVGGEGHNALAGGSGRDRITAGSGDDKIFGDGYIENQDGTVTTELQKDFSLPKEEYDDVIDAGDGDNQVLGGAGSDYIVSGAGDDHILGDQTSVDRYAPGLADNYVQMPFELHGKDVIHAGAGDDQVVGGDDDDTIYGGEGNDTLFGDDSDNPDFVVKGDDLVFGGAGNDVISGGAGDDRLFGDEGNDEIIAGDDNDYVSGGLGHDSIWGGEGNDTLHGDAGDDQIQGDAGDDVIKGGDGADTLLGLAGNDIIYGGAGDDWVQDSLNGSSGEKNTLYGGDGADTVLAGVGEDSLFGGDGDDHLQAGDGNDILEGGAGSDALLGQGGDDVLRGGHGTDYLFGHSGDDTYVFQAGDGLDLVRDTAGATKIEFAGGVHRQNVRIEQSATRTYLHYSYGDTVVMDNDSFLKLSAVSLADGTDYSTGDLQEMALEGRARQGRVVSGAISSGSYMGQELNQFSWFGGQLVGYNNSSSLDLGNHAAWSQGITSLTGPITYYTDEQGNVMAPVVDSDGVPQVPEGAEQQHVLWPDGSTTTTNANPVTEDSVLSDPDADNPAPEGTSGDSSGVSSDDEVLDGTEVDDTIDGEAGNDLIRGHAGEDVLNGGNGDDLLFGGDGNDTLEGGSGDDILSGGAGNDLVNGGIGNDTLHGDDGDDEINGGAGNDIITGGAGADTLDGGGGSDTYYFSVGDGADVIDHRSGINGEDKLKFESGIDPDDIKVLREGEDLILKVGESGDQVTVKGYFENEGTTYKAVDEIVFLGSNTSWDVEHVKALALIGGNSSDILEGYNSSDDTIYGRVGDDILNGRDGNDVLIGGEGNDTLNGGDGADSYRYELGDGIDTIIDDSGDENVLFFGEGISNDSLSLKRTGDDLQFHIDGGEVVSANNFFDQSGASLATVELADGTTFSASDLKAMILIGGEENDDIIDYETDDFVDGGQGNDTFTGGEGNDVYFFEAGDGADVLINNDNDESSADTVLFGSGITPDQVSTQRVDQDLIISYGSEDTLTIQSFFMNEGNSRRGIAGVEFSDGSKWSKQDLLASVLVGTAKDETLIGYSSDDTLIGGSGDDELEGGAGDDVYRFGKGDGTDTVYDTEGQDRIEFVDVTSSEVVVRREGNNLKITVPSTGDTVLVRNQFSDSESVAQSTSLETVEFSDGVSWTFDDLMAQATEGTESEDLIHGFDLDEAIDGQDGADDIFGHEGDDTIHGGAGNDMLDGGEGQDALHGATGDDELHGGDGTDELYGGVGADTLHGEQGDDLLFGEDGEDILHGGDGSDELYGGQDNDDLSGGSGADLLSGGAGDDVLRGGTGNDTLNGDAGNDILHGDSGFDILNGGAGDDELHGQGSDTLLGGEGNDILVANTDPWQETSNILEGGTGDDQLFGSYGDDTYRFDLGDGQDTLIETPDGEAYSNVDPSTDTLEFGPDIAPGDLSYTRTGDDLQISHENGTDGILIKSWFQEPTDHFKVNRFLFADGTEWSDLDVEEASVTVGTGDADTLTGYRDLNEEIYAGEGDDQVWGRTGDDVLHGEAGDDYLDGEEGDDHLIGGAGDDNLVGRSGADTLDGGIGNDTLQGGSGDDVLLGGAGEDSLFGGDGNDQLDGGADDDFFEAGAGDDVLNGGDGADQLSGGTGDDVLTGGLGDDKYVFAAGDGHDTIHNSDGGNDGVLFTSGATEDRIGFTRDGDDLVLLIDDGTEGSVRVVNHFLGGDHAIDWVQPDGGYMISTSEINQRVAAGESDGDFDSVVTGTSDGEELAGGSGRDLLEGLAGDDTLFGMGGDDQVEGGDGNDQIYGGNGGGTGSGNDVLIGGDGDDVLVGEDGDDTLIGGAGNDSYYYKAGQGVDVIDNQGGGSDGVFFLDGLDRDRLSYHQDGNDLVILVDGDLEQQVRVTDHFLGGDNAIAYVQPTDGGNAIMAGDIENLLSEMPSGTGDSGDGTGDDSGDDNQGTDPDPGTTPTPELGGDDVLTGGADNDILIGGVGNDTLDGGSGNDRLEGGVGDDTYIFTGGQDVLRESGGTDVLRFGAGITFNQVASGLMKSGDDLVMQVDGGPDQVTLTDFFLGGDAVIETIEFETGGQLTSDQIYGAFGLSEPTPASGFSQTVAGTSGDDSALDGGADADLIQGFNGDDALSGGAGNDRLEGGNGHDTLSGGLGDDTLIGGRGNDTYRFSSGDGQDVIDNVGGGNDTLHFEGITFNQVASGLMKSGNSLVLQVDGGTDSVTIRDFFSGGDQSIDQIEFESGGQLTADQIFGAFGLSNPDPQGSPDYQGLPDERGFGNVVTGSAAAETILASSDADFINGGAGDDIIVGGLGDDYLLGGAGDDTYRFAGGDGQDTINNLSNDAGNDQLHFAPGIDESQLWFARDGDDLVTSVLGSDDQVRVQDWYSADVQKLDSVHTDDAMISANQLEQLVTAMAAFGEPSGGEMNLTPQEENQVQASIASSWQPSA